MLDLDVRIKNKRDSEQNWTDENPILLNGELIIVDTENGLTKTKIGDGETPYNELPYADASLAEQIDEITSALNECFSKYGGSITGDVNVTGSVSTQGMFSDVVEIDLDENNNYTIDVTKSSCFTKTISSFTVFKFNGVPSNKASCFTLILTNGSSEYQVEWPESVKWADGTPPKLTENGTDVLTFITMDGGTTWYGCPSIINAL